MSNWGYARPSAALPKGRDAALNAIRINPDFARAHGILGYLTSIDVRHWLEASPHFQLALRLAPDDPRIRFWYATHLGRLGQHTEAISHLRFAREANPQLFAVGHQLAYEYQRAGRNGEFLDQAKELVRVQPQDSLAQLTLCRALIDNDNLAEARKALREAEHFRAPAPQLWFTRAVIAAAEGAPNRVSEAARELARLAEEGPVDSSLVAGAHVLAGDPAAALGYLRAGLARGDSTVLTAHAQTVFAGLKGSPEFKNFLRSTGWSLPPVK
jgi:tetratricopeptide (TPR) repeat protein